MQLASDLSPINHQCSIGNYTYAKIQSVASCCVFDRFFVPKLACRESEFFRELKKQDLCEDEVQKRNDASCEERGDQVSCDEVGSIVTQSRSSNNKQHDTDNDTRPAADADADNGDDDDVSGFTSLQSSCMSVYLSLIHI